MMPTPGGDFQGTERFQIVRRLQAGGFGVVYEAYDRQRNARVALKTLLHMDATGIYRFKQEFRSLAAIVHPNLVPLYELISDGERWFFTMELIDGVNLLAYVRGRSADPAGSTISIAPPGEKTDASSTSRTAEISTQQAPEEPVGAGASRTSVTIQLPGDGQWIPRPPLTVARPAAPAILSPPTILPDLRRLRRAFRQVAEGTYTLHQAGKLHRDIKPANVLVRPDGRVVLLDFGLVYPLSHAPHEEAAGDDSDSRWANRWADLAEQGLVAGTVAYMSPEQARAAPLTPASDWYAVGVMLYQALTGQLPFHQSRSVVLWAKQDRDAPAPIERIPGVPEDLNQLCVRLLCRDPEARPSGPEILAALAEGDEPSSITLPAVPSSVPEGPTFIGRDRHLAELRRTFSQMLEGRAAVCSVHGRSGAGKTVLVEHFLDEIAARGDVVILTGRCYEQESVPYKAVDSLVDALTRFLLPLSHHEVQPLLPPDVAALTRIFPVLTRIEAVAEAARDGDDLSDLRQLRARAFGALRELLARIAGRWPLVAWIDDLQWGDVDGAALLSYVLRPPGAPRLLLLLTYRSESIGVSPCLRALQIPTGDDAPVQSTIGVEALTPDEAVELAGALLGSDASALSEAQWVARESGGSAFFVVELARHLLAGLSTASSGGVDLDRILRSRVQGLPVEARGLLEAVAVAGQPVRLRIAEEAAGLGQLPPHIVSILRSEHLVRTTGPHLDDEIETYHDRIRESVVAQLDDPSRRLAHSQLADVLSGLADVEPETLAAHYEAAGRASEASRCYTVAAAKAVGLLAFDHAEDLYKKAATLAPSDQDRAAAYEQMVHFYTNMARFAEAYAVGRQGAALVGLKLPSRFRLPSFLLDYIWSRLLLRGRQVADLVHLPVMDDPRREAAVRIISAMLKAAYQVQPELNVALSTKGLNLCLRHGNTRHCTICYMAYGTIFQGGVLGRHEVGYEFGQLSLNLLEKFANTDQLGEVNFVVGYFAMPWTRPATEAESMWQVAYNAATEARCGGYEGAADLFNIGNSSVCTIMSYHMRGMQMREVWDRSERYLEVLRRAHLREPAGLIACVRQFIRNLRGETLGPLSLSDAEFDENEFVGRLVGFGCRHYAHFYHILKTQLLYLRGDYEAALEAARASSGYLNDSRGMLHWAEHHFYEALVQAARYPRLAGADRRRSLRTVRRAHRMFVGWAERCDHNFRHKERLLSAEAHRLRGRHAEARRAYEEAAAAAERYGYLPIQALARHRSAELARKCGDEATARLELAAARETYRNWGATDHADALDERTITTI